MGVPEQEIDAFIEGNKGSAEGNVKAVSNLSICHFSCLRNVALSMRQSWQECLTSSETGCQCL